MGWSTYSKVEKPDEKQKAVEPPLSEKTEADASFYDGVEPPRPPRTFHLDSSRTSVSGRSTRTGTSSLFLDDIRYEVMVNYLYQQQCSHLWISDGSGEIEGVLLRKSRGDYMACPSQLSNSPFALACAALNVQVCSSRYFEERLAG
jgi:hypothetical protein